jgi:radical SAM protein with 4Fe4S-binding SPASM domain
VPVPVARVPALVVDGRIQSMLSNRIRSWFGKSPVLPIPGTGVYHFRKGENGNSSRLHLRIDADGSGILIVNANQIFHLNPTAALITYYHLKDLPAAEALKTIQKNFDVTDSALKNDIEATQRQIDQLIAGETCPVCDLDLEINAPFSATPSAPYRMDLALTYRCNNSCTHCYNARARNYPELETEKWFSILDKLWNIGIPHIVFTGGEPTLRDDLPVLVNYAEKKGQITGLNTNGRKLGDSAFLGQLIEAGLDHIQITFESSVPEIHNEMVSHPKAWDETLAGLKNALRLHPYVMTNTTMLKTNVHTIPDTLRMLGDLGVKTVGLNALIYSGRGKSVGTGLSEQELFPLLDEAKKITQSYGQRLIWYTPTQYCNFDPVLNDLGVKGCTAALYNMCIEPNGDVLPCQSYYQSLGNMLDQPWDSIWNHDLSRSLRERKYLMPKCSTCALVSECGGGCPLSTAV